MDKMSTFYEMYTTLIRTAGETAANLWLETNLDEDEIESLMKYMEKRDEELEQRQL